MKTQKLVFVLAILSLLMASCQPATTLTQPPIPTNTGAPVVPTQTSVQPTTTTTTTLAGYAQCSGAKPITASVWTTDADSFRAAAAAYKTATGNTVNIEEINRDVLQEKVFTELQSKTGNVDIVFVPSEWVAQLAEGGLLEPLDSYMANKDLPQPDPNDWASPGAVEGYKYKGTLYGMPQSMSTVGLFYRTDLIQTPPEDFDQLLGIAEEQTKGGRYGMTIFGKIPESIAWDFINYFWGFGGQLLDENFQPHLNSPEGIAALTYFVDLYRKYKVVPEGSPTYEYPEIVAAFQQDKVAMALQWIGAWYDWADKTKSPLIYNKFNATLYPGKRMPDGSVHRATIGHVWGLAINSASNNKQDAYCFLTYFTSEPGLRAGFANTIVASGLNSKAILQDPEVIKNHPETPVQQKAFQYMYLWPNTTVTSELITTLATESSAALAGTKSPQQAMDDAQAEYVKILTKAGYIK